MRKLAGQSAGERQLRLGYGSALVHMLLESLSVLLIVDLSLACWKIETQEG